MVHMTDLRDMWVTSSGPFAFPRRHIHQIERAMDALNNGRLTQDHLHSWLMHLREPLNLNRTGIEEVAAKIGLTAQRVLLVLDTCNFMAHPRKNRQYWQSQFDARLRALVDDFAERRVGDGFKAFVAEQLAADLYYVTTACMVILGRKYQPAGSDLNTVLADLTTCLLCAFQECMIGGNLLGADGVAKLFLAAYEGKLRIYALVQSNDWENGSPMHVGLAGVKAIGVPLLVSNVGAPPTLNLTLEPYVPAVFEAVRGSSGALELVEVIPAESSPAGHGTKTLHHG